MKSLSIKSNHFLSPFVAPARSFTESRPALRRSDRLPGSPRPAVGQTTGRFSAPDDRVSNGLTLGLFTLTVPAVGYAFHQLWQLVGGETLNHAVQAFAP